MTEPAIVVDTSALTAIVFGEDDAAVYAGVLVAHAGSIAIGAPTWVETSIVTEARLGPAGSDLLVALLERVSATVLPLDSEIARAAVSAWRRFGKGRHPAQLNLGDCFSYAVARASGAPLLFKGRDFPQTDIRSALS